MVTPLRFAVSVNRPLDVHAIGELAIQAESDGFDILYTADHLGIPAPFSPWPPQRLPPRRSGWAIS